MRWLSYGLIAALFLVAQAWYSVEADPSDRLKIEQIIAADPSEYYYAAINLVKRGELTGSNWIPESRQGSYPISGPINTRLPLYPYFLAGFFYAQSLLGADLFSPRFPELVSYWPIIWTQIMLMLAAGLIVCSVVYELTKSWAIAFLSGVAFCFEPTNFAMPHGLWADTLLVFFIATHVLLVVRWIDSNRERDFILAAICAGLAALTKPVALPMIFALVVTALIHSHGGNRSIRRTLGLIFSALGIVLLFVFPWLTRNWFVFGHFSYNSQFGTNFALYNLRVLPSVTMPMQDMLTEIFDQAESAGLISPGKYNPFSVSSVAVRYAFNYLDSTGQWGAYLLACAKNIVEHLGATEPFFLYHSKYLDLIKESLKEAPNFSHLTQPERMLVSVQQFLDKQFANNIVGVAKWGSIFFVAKICVDLRKSGRLSRVSICLSFLFLLGLYFAAASAPINGARTRMPETVSVICFAGYGLNCMRVLVERLVRRFWTFADLK